jgi:ubiquitin carboxyl-terminal hydrolase 4/11/15
MGFGHYTAYSKNHRENKWYKFNDTLVTEASEKDVVSKYVPLSPLP